MESSPSPDAGLLDTHDTLSTLDYIVHFLHTEGFYAAEEALLREIENRYPECEEQGGQSVNTLTSEDSALLAHSAEQPHTSGRVGEWQQALEAIQSNGSRRAGKGSAQAAADSAKEGLSEPKHTESNNSTDPSHDQYSDDEDPGYTRQDIRGQEAFIARELDLSDDEGSHRGPIELQSSSRHPHDPESSSVPGSSHMAEAPGTSTYGSELPTDQSLGASHREHSNAHVSLTLPVSAQPESDQPGTAEKDAGHLIQQDSYRSEHSTESSASLTLTDKSRQDPPDDVDSASAQQQTPEPAAALTSTALVHQQSGFRYLLDGMLEKVSDAFGRHTPRSAAQGSEGSEASADTLSEAGDDSRRDEQSIDIPTLKTHRRRAPRTPAKAQSSFGDGDSENFSFPVTPPSEPAPAGPVFGHGFGRASSGVSHGESEYTTDGRETNVSPSGTSLSDISPQQLSVGGTGTRRHRNLIDVIQDLEQENAADAASTGMSPASDRPVPLDLSCSVSDPDPVEAKSPVDAELPQGLAQPPRPSATGSEPMPSPPGLEVIPDLEEAAPEDDDAPHAHLQHSPQPPGWNGPMAPSVDAEQARADSGPLVYDYDQEYVDRKYELLSLKVIHRRQRTGFEETKDFPIRVNDLVAGRYQVMDFLGSAAFSKAVQALDTKTGMLVCLKIIKNNKDYFDQSLDEIKLLKYINEADPNDEHGMLRLFDYFYYKEHLFLVCELLRANLYEFQKYNRENGDEPYFTLPHLQRIAQQVLRSIAFLHALNLIHSDLKPENILVKSYSRCEVKVIDLGSSCFTSDHLSSYVQSRSYRAPEVILGLPYDQKIDIWSFGCILAELLTGSVLFQNDSLATLLARLEGILEPVPEAMTRRGRFSHRFYTRQGRIYERSQRTGRYEFLIPKQTSLEHRLQGADEGFIDFIRHLLAINPTSRPSAEDALQHPWLQLPYEQGV